MVAHMLYIDIYTKNKIQYSIYYHNLKKKILHPPWKTVWEVKLTMLKIDDAATKSHDADWLYAKGPTSLK